MADAPENLPRHASAKELLGVLKRIDANQRVAERKLNEIKVEQARTARSRYGPGGGAPIVEGGPAGPTRARFTAYPGGPSFRDQRKPIDEASGALVRYNRNLDRNADAARRAARENLRYIESLRALQTQFNALRASYGVAPPGLPPGRVPPGLPPGAIPPQLGSGATIPARLQLNPPGRNVGGIYAGSGSFEAFTRTSPYIRGGFDQRPGGTAAGRAAADRLPGAIRPEAASNVKAYYQELQRAALIQQSASQQMRRHGALTTEFLSALARGETTLSEFRFQLGATIGKFAGWTAAAASVYAVVDAVRTLGTGAVDSLTGVKELSRFVTSDFDPNKAQKGFRQLSREYNLPISTVVEAQSGIAKVIPQQDQSLEATKTILKAIQVGELDAADATKYFGAIVRGFKLEAKDLPDILDQFNAAQNKLGLSIPDTAAGVARATGAFKQAGGTRDTLIALATTLRYLTGESGTTVGTALARSVTRVRRVSNQAVLRRYGIDPDAPLDNIFKQALAIAPELSGAQRVELGSKGLSTPEYGRFFTALLGNPETFNRVAGITNPDAARGSADAELKTRLSSVQQVAKSIGVELQNLGSNLAQSGLLDGFGVILKTLQLTLKTANDLMEVFNAFPAPIRDFAAYALEGYAALALIRRTGFGQGLRERGLPIFGSSPAEVERRSAIRTSRAVGETLADRNEQLANQTVGARTNALIAANERDRLRELAREETDTNKKRALQKEINNQGRASIAAQKEAAVLATRQQATQTLLNAENQKLAGLQRRQLTAAQAGYAYGAGGGIGSGAPPRSIGGAGATVAETAAVGAASGSLAGRIGRRAGFGRLKQVPGQARLFAGELAASTKALVGVFGAVDLALGAAFITYQSIQATNERNADRRQKIRALSQPISSVNDAQRRLKDAEKLREQPDIVSAAAFTLDRIPGFDQISDARERSEREAKRLERIRNRATDFITRGNITRTRVVPRLALQQVYDRFDQDQKQYEDYNDLRAAANRRIQEILNSALAKKNGADDPRVKAAMQKVRRDLASSAGAKDISSDPNLLYRGLDPEGRQQLNQRFLLGRLDRTATYRGLIAGLTDTASSYAGASDPKLLQEVANAEEALDKAVEDRAQEGLSAAKRATTGRGQRQGYARARKAYTDAIAEIRGSRTSLVGTRDRIQRELDAAEAQVDNFSVQGRDSGSRAGGPAARSNLQSRADSLRAQLKSSNTRLRRSRQAILDRIQFLEDGIKEIDRQEFQTYTERASTRLAYRQSLTNDSTARLADAVRTQGGIVREAVKRFGRNSNEALQAITQQNELNDQLAQDRLTSIQSRSNYRTSLIGGSGQESDLARRRSDLQGVREKLNQQRKDNADPDEIRDTLTEINNLKRDIAETARDYARAVAEARFNFKLAGILDPIKRAREQLKFDQSQLKGLTGIDRINQLTKIREDKTNLKQTLLDEELADLRHRHNLEKLTDDQYVEELKKILNTKKLSRDMRRQLEEEIFNINKATEGDLSLNLDDLKLPTLYEIKKVVGRASEPRVVSSGPQVTTTNHNSFSLTVKSPADVREVIAAIEVATGQSAGDLRSLGLLD